MNPDRILFQYEIRSKLCSLELQRQRIYSSQQIAVSAGASPVHDVDFYSVLLRRILREIEEAARYDSRVANLKGKNSALFKKIKLRDHFEHGLDQENVKPTLISDLPKGTIFSPDSESIKISTSLLNDQITSSGLTWHLKSDHQKFIEVAQDFSDLYPFVASNHPSLFSRIKKSLFKFRGLT